MNDGDIANDAFNPVTLEYIVAPESPGIGSVLEIRFTSDSGVFTQFYVDDVGLEQISGILVLAAIWLFSGALGMFGWAHRQLSRKF